METNWEYPKEITIFPKIVSDYMQKAAAYFCKKIDIPAEPAIGDHWIH